MLEELRSEELGVRSDEPASRRRALAQAPGGG